MRADQQSTIVALHWPQVTAVAADLPNQGWHRAINRRGREPYLPVANTQAVAVTYWTRSTGQLHVRLPLDHRRAARAMALTERYAQEEQARVVADG